jgi:hypothetical protein
MKTYDLVYALLKQKPELRNSDKKLLWEVWKYQGYIIQGSSFEYLPYLTFMKKNIPHFETVRRSRQKIQELHPELQASPHVAQARRDKQVQKGTWIFREETQTYRYEDA